MTITADAAQAARRERSGLPGEVFTRRWVVDLILDLCGYTLDQDLTEIRLLDPAVGAGAFLFAALDRLLDARAKHQPPDSPWSKLDNALIATDISPDHVSTCRRMAAARLRAEGCPPTTARRIATAWIRPADFLLAKVTDRPVDVIVGNPPYVRIEDLPGETLTAYRTACPTMTGRADLYIGFFERALDLLAPGGRLGFICADRWMRNQYGRNLRAKVVSGGIAVDTCLVMHDVAAFEEDVSAYPAITIMRRGAQGPAVVGDANEHFDGDAATDFATWVERDTDVPLATASVSAARLPHWHTTVESWPDGSPATLSWLEHLEDTLPVLEDESTGTRIRIGVATGADAVYVTRSDSAVEKARMLPLAMPADIKTGTFAWTGHYLVNPWEDEGLVELEAWPQFERYLRRHIATVMSRAVAKNNKQRWYRTIDRVTMSVTDRPKLLLEDMKAKANPVLEHGGHYPHHNLYYLVSDGWDLEVLGGLLLSDVVERQISAYCVKMRGRTLRFQAQYLRRVRAPRPAEISTEFAEELRMAFRTRDRQRATQAALGVYGLDRVPT